MADRPPRKPKPYVFVFQLGKHAKVGKKRVPAAFSRAPCYYYREGDEALAKKLQDIPEPDVSDADADVTFAAIDDFVERCELKPELYSDVEIEADEEHTEQRGFHAAATHEKARDALARGGFVVCRVIDPLAIPRVELTPAETVELAVEELGRHLDLTSLPLVLDRIEQGAELPRHASQAGSLLTATLGSSNAEAFAGMVRAEAPRWHAELRDTLLVLVGRALEAEAKGPLRTFLDALPAAESPDARRQLAAWGLPPGGSAVPDEPVKPVKEKATDRGKKAR